MLNFAFKAFLFVIKVITLVYNLASATSLGFLIIVGAIVFALSRYFRLKQPELPQNLIEAIGGNQFIEKQHTTGHQNNRSECNETVEWLPIANRAACLDSVENSRSAIEKVSHK